MSQRNPFEMIGSCPVLGVTVPPLELMLFCSTPALTYPTFALPSPVLPELDVAPPGDCVCLAISVRLASTIDETLRRVKFSGYYTDPSPDCCRPEPRIEMQLDIPCMPLTADADMRVTMKYDIDRPVVDAYVSRKENCELRFHMDMDMPCMPVTIQSTAHITVDIDTNRIRPSMHMDMTRVITRCVTGQTCYNECGLGVVLDIALPCMPFTFWSQTGGLSQRITCIPPAEFNVQPMIERISGECAFRLGGVVYAPPIPRSFGYMGIEGAELFIYGGTIAFVGRGFRTFVDGTSVTVAYGTPCYIAWQIPATATNLDGVTLVCKSVYPTDDGTYIYKVLHSAYWNDETGSVCYLADLRNDIAIHNVI